MHCFSSWVPYRNYLTRFWSIWCRPATCIRADSVQITLYTWEYYRVIDSCILCSSSYRTEGVSTRWKDSRVVQCVLRTLYLRYLLRQNTPPNRPPPYDPRTCDDYAAYRHTRWTVLCDPNPTVLPRALFLPLPTAQSRMKTFLTQPVVHRSKVTTARSHRTHTTTMI